MSLHVCTVVTPDHVARARVLARSLREHHPDARFTALVVGDAPAPAEPFEVLSLEALDCPPLEAMIAAYEPFALMCALKPWLLLAPASSRARPSSTSTPTSASTRRSTTPSPRGRTAWCSPATCSARCRATAATRRRRTSCVAGAFNGGFLGVGRDARGFLAWWAERLAQECTIDPARGLFLDQRWLELAPGSRPATVLRDPGFNAGFWDVPNRPLTGGPGAYAVAGVPLRCFHFSGFDPDRPDVLSAHQNRVDLASHPALARLVSDYAGELHAAGHAAPAEPARPPSSRRWRAGSTARAAPRASCACR